VEKSKKKKEESRTVEEINWSKDMKTVESLIGSFVYKRRIIPWGGLRQVLLVPTFAYQYKAED